jgi:hypothetical protein
MPVCRITANARTAWPGITRTALPLAKNSPRNGKVMKLNKLPRMSGWIVITILLTIAIYMLAPKQLDVSLYKLSLITTAAVVGYWIDRSLFPYARPDGYLSNEIGETWHEQVKDIHINNADVPVVKGYELVFAVAMLRRAIIIGCAMLGVSLGL